MKNKITCTYIGHATTLISIGKTNILTDPHFGGRTLFFKRRAPLSFDPSLLPDLACVLISHTHFDHLHVSSFKYIARNVPVVVPEGCEGAVGKFIENPVIELSLFAAHRLPDGTKITAVPARHRGGRFSQLRFATSCGYLIERDGAAVFFTGDSAYGEHFAKIADLAEIDLALLPISGYSPQWFMSNRHMTPSQAVDAFEDLKARHMMPIHWGSFSLSLESPGEPIERLTKILEDRPDLKERVHIMPHGEKFTIEKDA